MAKRVLLQCIVAVLVIIALMGESTAIPMCGIETEQLNSCLNAVKGESPPPPTKQCCDVVCHAQLPCLCGYKRAFSQFGIDPKDALALPKKCGIKKIPRECHWP